MKQAITIDDELELLPIKTSGRELCRASLRNDFDRFLNEGGAVRTCEAYETGLPPVTLNVYQKECLGMARRRRPRAKH